MSFGIRLNPCPDFSSSRKPGRSGNPISPGGVLEENLPRHAEQPPPERSHISCCRHPKPGFVRQEDPRWFSRRYRLMITSPRQSGLVQHFFERLPSRLTTDSEISYSAPASFSDFAARRLRASSVIFNVRPTCSNGALAQIPKFGNRARARPRRIGVLCRQRPPFALQFFCSVSPTVKHSDSRGRRRARARFLNFGV